MIDKKSLTITTIAGKHDSTEGLGNDLAERDPMKLNLPEISSMDYYKGNLFVPTDITSEEGDLAVLRKSAVR